MYALHNYQNHKYFSDRYNGKVYSNSIQYRRQRIRGKTHETIQTNTNTEYYYVYCQM